MRTCVAAVVIAASFALNFSVVTPGNFGGSDEWLYISSVSKGVLGVPYANRPLAFLMAQPVRWIAPWSLWSYFFVHGSYLAATGFVTFLVARRLAGFGIALLAGIFAAVYAPTDFLRLDCVITDYAGFTLAATIALLCLVEAARRTSLKLLLAGAAIGSVAARGYEGMLPLLVTAPMLLGFLEGPGSRRHLLRLALLWEAALLPIVTLAGWPIVHPPAGGSYQSTLGFDPRPLALLGRMLDLFGFAYRPLFSPPFHSAGLPAVLVAVLILVLGYVVALRTQASCAEPVQPRRRLAALCGLGIVMALAAWAPYALTAATVGPARSQYLSAAGIGLSLAAGCGLLASFAPTRFRAASFALFGSWVVAVAAMSTFDLQRQWSASSYWKPQRMLLSRLVARVPDVPANTLLMLLDGQAVFPANFTFRHAVEMLYEGRALGLAWGAKPFLYPARLDDAGVAYEPLAAIRAAWRVAPTRHRWADIILLRWTGDEMVVLESWPAGLGTSPRPPGYDPLSRIVPSLRPPQARQLLRGFDVHDFADR